MAKSTGRKPIPKEQRKSVRGLTMIDELRLRMYCRKYNIKISQLIRSLVVPILDKDYPVDSDFDTTTIAAEQNIVLPLPPRPSSAHYDKSIPETVTHVSSTIL